MKKFCHFNRRPSLFSVFVLSLIFLVPPNLFGQKGNGNKEINILVSCTEYIGNGKVQAWFGYENPSNKVIVINEDGSVVTYNHGQAKKYGIYTFEPGVKEKAFSQEFEVNDRVEWTVTLPNGKVKTVDADIHSNHCNDAPTSLNIIPGYLPPEGGKEYNSRIGAELTSLYKAYSFDPAGFTGATDDIFQIDGTKVLIEVVAESGQYAAMIASLTAVGFDLLTAKPATNRATGWVAIENLLLLNEMAALYYARPVYPGVSNYIVPATGLVRSQGDFAMHSDFARLGFDINGSGVKIGVLSNSYNTRGNAHIDVTNGDLPGAGNPNGYTVEVDILKDIAPTFGALSDEGRAMLQIVHDIAPGAELAFRTGYLGEQDMANGIRELANAGTDIIVDDLSYITEPFFRDGVISQAIDSVVSEGVSFFSSAGNFGRTSYMGTFNSVPAPPTITGTAHNFGGGDIFQNVLLPEGSYTLVLQWDDGSDTDMTSTLTDLDIFLSDDAGFSLLGFNRENLGGFPIEVVPFSVQGDSVYANIVVARAHGTLPVTFKYMLFRGGSQFKMLEYGGESSTIVGHPNAAGAISVGAVRYDKNPIYNSTAYPQPVIMSFSSIGGTPVNGVIRDKPDITAPNGVNTTVDLGNGDWDDPMDPDTQYPNFFGTSAASPHAAGVAALIMEAKLKYDSVSHVDPETIRELLRSTALDMDSPGKDLVSGSGFIQAHKALMTFANPTPYVENLILVSEGGVPGESITPFSFTITGDFFTDSTQVIFRGDALEDGVVIEDEHTITVDHPGFLGNPEIKVFNPVISGSGLDGGYSEGLYFSDPVKQRVVITADNLIKKYGELIPEYSATFQLITVDGDSLSFEEGVQIGIMLQEEADRLSTLSYSTPAEDTTGAGQYLIVPSLSPELDMANPLTEVDNAITEKYILEFVNSSLTIDKLALKITPVDMEMVYGDEIPAEGIRFLYEIGDSSVLITNPESVLMGVQQEHLAALTNEIALVRGVALVNGIPMIRGVALVNGVTMVRGVALVNGVEVKVEMEGTDTTVYVAGEAIANGGTLIRGVALVNDLPFVNMTEIVRGVALVNSELVTFENGFMTALNGIPLENAVAAVRGVALVNGSQFSRGVALVNGHEVVYENGVTTIDGELVPNSGIVLVNGIPVVRGVALVNSTTISRGVALVNGLEVPIENGIPSVRGIALVNGIPLIRGTALVNNLEVNVEDGEVTEVFENGTLVNGLTMSRGIALVNGVALVNGTQLSRGVALVNGIALVNESGSGEDVVNLENMNFLASGTALVNGTLPSVRGVALVNGIEGADGQSLKIAAGTIQDDGTIVYENAFTTSRGIALVNGLSYVRGVALVNGDSLTNGIPLVNGSTIDENSNSGTILVFDATDVGAPAEEVNLTPISFITGTTAGQHWIVPGTFLSNNFEITYGLGKLTIDPAGLTIIAEDKTKTYGEEDPELTYTPTGLLSEDAITGALIREDGEDVGEFAILQGSLNAGDNYTIYYDSATLTINQRLLEIELTADDKVYDGSTDASTSVSTVSGLIGSDDVTVTSGNGLFDNKNVGPGKQVTAVISTSGGDAGNYAANTTAATTASITEKELVIVIDADDRIYDGTYTANTTASVFSGLVTGDDVWSSSSNGMFADKNVGTWNVTADVSSHGTDAGNYTANTTATDLADITQREVRVTPGEPFLYIFEEDPLPEFAFIYNGWIPGDAGNEGYTVLRDSDGVPYDQTSSNSTGYYTVTPVPSNTNYLFTLETGVLYVNPAGPSTKAVKPVLNCIQEIDTDYYVANFEYKNDNNVAVYIPVGPDNLLEGSGIDWENSEEVPEWFAPGGGSFRVFFDGTDISWNVSTLDKLQKVRNGANASSSSTKCTGNTKSATVSAAIEEIIPGTDELVAYPNPVTDKVHLTMKDIENYKLVQLYDFAGRSFPITSIDKRTDNLEIDMEQLSAGHYFIKVVMGDSTKVVQIIKH